MKETLALDRVPVGAAPGDDVDVTSSRRALVVMPAGPTRKAVARVLRGLGVTVSTAAEPFEATASFARRPADFVIASLEGWTRRDLGFLPALRAASPSAWVVVLAREGRRALASAALAKGADAYLLEPLDLDELEASAKGCLARLGVSSAEDDPAALTGLAAEIGHAVNNPLQVLSLLADRGNGSAADDIRAGVRAESSRIARAVDLVTSFGRIGKPVRTPIFLDGILAEALHALESEGAIRSTRLPTDPEDEGPSPEVEGVEASLDGRQVRTAVEGLLRFLAAQSDARPAPLKALARRRSTDSGSGIEVAVRVKGVTLTDAAWARALASVLSVDDRTREPYPGLALCHAVAKAHGGQLVRKEGKKGTVVTLRFSDS